VPFKEKNMRPGVRVMLLAGALCAGPAVQAQEILVSAAASLTDALREIGRDFEQETPEARVRFNFAAAGVLRAQIEQGAPADVFVSSDELEMRRLREAGLAGESVPIATGVLVLAVPAGAAGVESLEDLRGPAARRIAIGSPRTVPAGRYARQTLETLGLWAEIEPRVVYAENVRQVLRYVQTGAVQAGFVYGSDAHAGAGVRAVAQVPDGVHDQIVYLAAALRRSARPELARRFVEHLRSPAGQASLRRSGFRPVPAGP
jgi:molybdate transport system substrate-binding protein